MKGRDSVLLCSFCLFLITLIKINYIVASLVFGSFTLNCCWFEMVEKKSTNRSQQSHTILYRHEVKYLLHIDSDTVLSVYYNKINDSHKENTYILCILKEKIALSTSFFVLFCLCAWCCDPAGEYEEV